eukprot:gene9018-10685_t
MAKKKGGKSKKQAGRKQRSGRNDAKIAGIPEVHIARQAMPEEEEEEDDTVLDSQMGSVVKIFCVHTFPNFSLPWQRNRQYSSSSTGFAISGRRLLTNAHSVEHYTQVKVKRRGDDTKFVARVLTIGTECDIALLTVDDDAFWEGLESLEFGTLPKLQDGVAVVGYPVGGDTISVTSGVVSRIEVTSYVHGMTDLLTIQIDAAINSGNSGGPVFNAYEECVGIAFQSLRSEDAENIGYVIPTPVVQHFLHDFETNSRYTGFPVLGIEWQTLESPALRSVWSVPSEESGVLVRRVLPTAPAAGLLQRDDIILEFDGVSVANDGTVKFRKGERIAFGYLVSQKFIGDEISMRILRKGVPMEIEVVLQAPHSLIPSHIKGEDPSYFITAGLVFTVVSELYLRSEFGTDYMFDAPVHLLYALHHELAEETGEKVVILAQVLSAEVNLGYEDVQNTRLRTFNGAPVRSLEHLVEMVESCEEQFLQFDLF